MSQKHCSPLKPFQNPAGPIKNLLTKQPISTNIGNERVDGLITDMLNNSFVSGGTDQGLVPRNNDEPSSLNKALITITEEEIEEYRIFKRKSTATRTMCQCGFSNGAQSFCLDRLSTS